jgi:hypothetical protein
VGVQGGVACLGSETHAYVARSWTASRPYPRATGAVAKQDPTVEIPVAIPQVHQPALPHVLPVSVAGERCKVLINPHAVARKACARFPRGLAGIGTLQPVEFEVLANACRQAISSGCIGRSTTVRPVSIGAPLGLLSVYLRATHERQANA